MKKTDVTARTFHGLHVSHLRVRRSRNNILSEEKAVFCLSECSHWQDWKQLLCEMKNRITLGKLRKTVKHSLHSHEILKLHLRWRLWLGYWATVLNFLSSHLLLQRGSKQMCLCLCVCTWYPYIMGAKRPYKNRNSSILDLVVGTCFAPREELINHIKCFK